MNGFDLRSEPGADCRIGEGATLDASARWGRNVTLGDGAHVGPGGTLYDNAEIGPGCSIGADQPAEERKVEDWVTEEWREFL